MNGKRLAVILKGMLLALPRMTVFSIYTEGCKLYKTMPVTSNIYK